MGSIIGQITDPIFHTDLQGNGARSAALGDQQGATNEANNYARQAYADQKNYLNPYITGGQDAFKTLQSGNFQMDPGYQFRLSEGQKAINNAASARGMFGGGAAAKQLARYGQDYASGEYQNAFNRQNTLANYGFNAANSLGGYAGQYGQTMGQNALGMGNARASSGMSKWNQQNGDLNQAIQLGAAYFTGGGSAAAGSLGGGGSGQNMGLSLGGSQLPSYDTNYSNSYSFNR